MSGFWSIFVIVLFLVQVIGALWLLQNLTSNPQEEGEGETTGHTWDGDLDEGNNPLPRWWLILFWITAIWTAIYLVIYPGFGSFEGISGWSQESQYEAELATAEERYGDIFAVFADVPLAEMASDPDAIRLGRNLYLNNCATCHGSDARGARGFPNLTDDAWLGDSSPEGIQRTIMNGRVGVMPALGAALGEEGTQQVVEYTLSLSGDSSAGADTLAAGAQKYQQFCMACHGTEGKGMAALGAPNLTDGVWLHGGTATDITDVIVSGRTNIMPAQKDLLTEDRIRTIVAYVLSLNES